MAVGKPGKLYGISAGPGDPDLITVKALKLLQQVPVVAFPAGRQGQPGIAQRIVTPWLRPEQQQVPLFFALVQDEAKLQAAWAAAAATIEPYLQQGQDVAFVSEGDVSFYSTFTYLVAALRERCPGLLAQAVPGVCSPLGAAAELGLPLTIGTQKLAVLPTLHSLSELEQALRWAEVVVLLKVSSVYPQVWQILRQHDLLRQSHIVLWATGQEQVLYSDLSQHADLQLPYFSLLLVQRSQETSKISATCGGL
ncbi:precorrin-2 C(20)-methyltransferase [Leptolyngbya sp. FACHB-261]|nr:precorrin-2 C(20)-methyltransferase [Leptolyngbya sp. FACHB-261]